MSTDNSELTFVRCPSCRSLVPAVSTRCRMCGATLDATAKADESEEERKKPGRVRQKTMTQSQSELMQAAGQIRQEMAAEESSSSEFADEAASEELDSDSEGFDNPLGQYLDEDPAETSEANGSTSESSSLAAFLDEDPIEAAPVMAEAPEEKPEPVREEPKPRVTVQSGGRPPGKTSGLSFGKPREEKQSRVQDRDEDSGFEKPSSRSAEKVALAPDQSHRREAAPAKQEDVKEVRALSEGKLFGWLVSYDKKEGSAIELREGRFFVNSTMLKPSDLVISNKNLSTPHALVAVSAGQGLRVQDLMSEGGVYVRRKNSASFQREEGTVTVEHGDWIKFADAEFLVALVSS